MASILVVDDTQSTLRAMGSILRREGYEVYTANSGPTALQRLHHHDIDLLISDLNMPRMNGLELLRTVKAQDPGIVVIIMSGMQDITVAVKAIKDGAFDYLVKPLTQGKVLRTAQKALALRQHIQDQFERAGVIGSSPAWRRVQDFVQPVAPSRATVLISGERGTGKNRIATLLRDLSPRVDKPLITVNIAAFPSTRLEAELFGHEKRMLTGAGARRQGQFELANGGTLLLDEIGDLPLAVQVKVLRVLQDGSFKRLGGTYSLHTDVRVLTTTRKTLSEEMRAGRFRKDLYDRLNVIAMRLPPLRERVSDISLLVEHFIHKYAEQNVKKVESIQEAALNPLQAYGWPGNVRELETVIERAVLSTPSATISTRDLGLEDFQLSPPHHSEGRVVLPFPSSLAEIERDAILQTLAYCGGNRQRTARYLAIAPATLYRKIKAYNIVGHESVEVSPQNP